VSTQRASQRKSGTSEPREIEEEIKPEYSQTSEATNLFGSAIGRPALLRSEIGGRWATEEITI
jgi:hypothetical protein